MIDFPTSPVANQTYTFNGRTWVWNGSGWERQINAGQNVAIFFNPGVEVQTVAAALPTPIGTTWQLVNYV